MVVLFGLPEGSRGHDLGGYGKTVRPGGVELGDLGPSLHELLVRMGEEYAAILGSPVRPLAINLGRIVESEERVEKRLIR